MTYAELVQLIQDTTANTETSFVTNIPNFVRAAEARVFNSVQLPAFRHNMTGSATTGNKYLTLPTDWLATYSLAVIDPITSAQTYLINKDVDYIREVYPTPSSSGQPIHYAQFDADTLVLGPTPDQDYGMELHFFYYPTSIVDAGTSWLGDNFPNVLLYGALREAYIYMKGEADVLAMYEQKYQEDWAMLKQLGDGKNRRDAYRSGQTRVPVG